MITKNSAYLFLLFLLLASACVPSTVQTDEAAQAGVTTQSTQPEIVPIELKPTDTPFPISAIPEPTAMETLNLSTDLVRGCDRRDGTDPKLQEGDKAVEFILEDVTGSTFTLSELLSEKPVALIYGSFT